MKRLLFFLLTALLMTGCSAQPLPETTAPTVKETEPMGVYMPESTAEQETDGAVRVYALDTAAFDGLYSMGTHLLVVTEEELLTLTGDKGVLSAKLAIGADTQIACVDAAVTGVGYYLPYTREVEVLNPQLQKTASLEMPEDMVGEPVVSMAQNQIFYATDTEIRAIDMHTGISRLIRKQSDASQIRLESHFGGTMLACGFINAAGESRTEYISSETGQSIDLEQSIFALQTYGEQYVAHYTDGTEEQLVFGSKEGTVQVIRLPQITDARIAGQEAVLAMNGVLSYGETELGVTLSFLDLSTGKRTAQTVLPGLQAPVMFCCDGSYIWFLAAEKGSERLVLYRWDITASAIRDPNVYTQQLFTAEKPDEQGLAACRERADALENQYGIKLSIWKDAQKNAGEYAVIPEHNPNSIYAALTALEGALQQFPNGFWEETVAGNIHILLVRSVEERDAVQFWDGGDVFVLLSTETDVVRWFYQTVARAIDSHVLGNSRDFDGWNQLNPEGFDYAYSYEIPEQSQYLEGENRAFADISAMSYPYEDRCSVFAYAMLSDSAEVFASDIMQAKLLRLCMGIREAYGLEKSPESYPWEQYLENTIAFKGE